MNEVKIFDLSKKMNRLTKELFIIHNINFDLKDHLKKNGNFELCR